MNERTLRILTLTAAIAAIALVSSNIAMGETRLYVPQFRYGPREDTQFLVANTNDRDVTLDVWAFTSNGELLGQFQLAVRAHGTRALTVGEAFGLSGEEAAGWVGAVSSDEGIQLSYTHIGEETRSYEARQWTSKEVQLTIHDLSKEVMRVSNPNAFAAQVAVRSTDSNGRFLGVREISVGPFAQLELPVAHVGYGNARQLDIVSSADLFASIDEGVSKRQFVRSKIDRGESVEMALVIDTKESLGAYQITLSFDPELAQFSAKDVEGGSAEGFESKPLVINADNVEGRLTLGGFQVGAAPAGRVAVARLRLANQAVSQFRIHVDEVSDVEGDSMSAADFAVGLVRVR